MSPMVAEHRASAQADGDSGEDTVCACCDRVIVGRVCRTTNDVPLCERCYDDLSASIAESRITS